MNGSQDVRQQYPHDPAAPPPPGRPPDPSMPGQQPPVWRQNVYDVGVPPAIASDPRSKSPALAAILSAMPGLGQVYVGYYQQGFAHVLIVGTLIVLLASNAIRGLEPFFGFFLAFFWLYNMIDAYRRATYYNQALAGIGTVELPPEISLPKGQGSLIGGVAMIGIGLLLVANTAFGMSLDWLEEWWPMGLVLMGVYLVYASLAARKKAEGNQ